MMDNIREKLVELLREVQYLGGLEEKVADHLLANGVTVSEEVEELKADNQRLREMWAKAVSELSKASAVQEWIPVSERLPTKEDANEFDEILTVTRNGTVTPYFYDKVAYYQKDFPYWMPWSELPQPPKGE